MVYVHHTCAAPQRSDEVLNLCYKSYRLLQILVWVMGTKPGLQEEQPVMILTHISNPNLYRLTTKASDFIVVLESLRLTTNLGTQTGSSEFSYCIQGSLEISHLTFQ